MRSPELPRRLGVELTEDGVRNGLERSCAGREKDPGRTSISDVRAARDQTVALEQTRHGRHRLLAQSGSSCEVAQAQPVLLEQRYEQRPVRRPHLGEAGGGKSPLE